MESKPFVIKRVFKAPLDLVWDCQTQVKHLEKWLSPAGFSTIKASQDFRVGGIYHYGQKGPDGMEMWGKQTYKEITPKTRLVLIQCFSDKDGGITRHPMAATWPKETLSTISLKALGPKETELTIEWLPYNATEEELNTFNGAFEGMNQGFGGTFAKLEEYLAKLQ
jgi:uncharacterized protein YndB with AHSA1/START domain